MPVNGIFSLRVVIALLQDMEQDRVYHMITKRDIDEVVQKAIAAQQSVEPTRDGLGDFAKSLTPKQSDLPK